MPNFKIIMMGRSGAGKSSTRSAMFHGRKDFRNMGPTEEVTYSSYGYLAHNIDVVDYSGTKESINSQLSSKTSTFSEVDAMMFFFDAGVDDMANQLDHYRKCFQLIGKYSPNAKVFIWLHRCDLIYESYEKTLENLKLELGKCNKNLKLELEKCNMCNKIIDIGQSTPRFVEIMATTLFDDTVYIAWSSVFRNVMPAAEEWREKLKEMRDEMDLNRIILIDKRCWIVVADENAGQKDNWNLSWNMISLLKKEDYSALTMQLSSNLVYANYFLPNLLLICATDNPSVPSIFFVRTVKKWGRAFFGKYKGQLF